MRPGKILPWLPVVRELVELGEWIADRVRKRRARRRAQRKQ